MVYRTIIGWHDLRIDPDDTPDEDENVLVTIENHEGTRRVVANVYFKKLWNGQYAWTTLTRDIQTGKMEETMVWEKVLAWAYYPNPCPVY